jgi:hypothetical protein
VDQSRLRIASFSRRASRPTRTLRESVWAVLPMLTLRRAPASPFAHALYVFLCVVAVANAVAKGGREEAPPLPRPEPLDGDAQLAGRLRDPVGGWPVLSHVPKIRGAPQRVYRNWLGKPIPVLGPRALTADNPTWPSRCRRLWQVSVHVAPPGMGQVSAPGSMPPSGV